MRSNSKVVFTVATIFCLFGTSFSMQHGANEKAAINKISYVLDKVIFEISVPIHAINTQDNGGANTSAIYINKGEYKDLLAMLLMAYQNGESLNINWINGGWNGLGVVNSETKIYFEK